MKIRFRIYSYKTCRWVTLELGAPKGADKECYTLPKGADRFEYWSTKTNVTLQGNIMIWEPLHEESECRMEIALHAPNVLA